MLKKQKKHALSFHWYVFETLISKGGETFNEQKWHHSKEETSFSDKTKYFRVNATKWTNFWIMSILRLEPQILGTNVYMQSCSKCDNNFRKYIYH